MSLDPEVLGVFMGDGVFRLLSEGRGDTFLAVRSGHLSLCWLRFFLLEKVLPHSQARISPASSSLSVSGFPTLSALLGLPLLALLFFPTLPCLPAANAASTPEANVRGDLGRSEFGDPAATSSFPGPGFSSTPPLMRSFRHSSSYIMMTHGTSMLPVGAL